MAKESLAEARSFVADRTPASLRESSLAQALRRQADGLAAQTGLVARFAVEGDERPLPMAVNVVLLRAAQEAGTNVRKHADARAVDLVLRYDGSHVGLQVTDDGRGFDAAQADDGAAEGGQDGPGGGDEESGFGLRGMAARLAEIGGAMSVVSAPGAGTVVEVTVPLDGAAGRPDGPSAQRSEVAERRTEAAHEGR